MSREEMVSIRKLTENDAEALWRLRLYALETDPISFGESPEELRKMTVEEYASRLRPGDTGNFVFGAFEGEAMVAMTGFCREAAVKRRHKGWIWGVFVSPSARGKGVGRTLLAGVIEAAKALPGIRYILLTVSTTQQSAIKLYQHLGFRSYGIEPHALKVGERYIDEHHMILELDGSSR
jgi:ribosomal protein S18 acetylase RimI-like enzyme